MVRNMVNMVNALLVLSENWKSCQAWQEYKVPACLYNCCGGPDEVCAQLGSGREAWSVLVEVVSHTLVVYITWLGLSLQRTAGQHSDNHRHQTF